jgi:ATP-binding cassette subfamily G (WHITE) protein 2 (SNQ2)
MTDVFTWQHMNYKLSDRQLLNDVSGYVAPGKLTALMGESGAGKVRAINRFCVVRCR